MGHRGGRWRLIEWCGVGVGRALVDFLGNNAVYYWRLGSFNVPQLPLLLRNCPLALHFRLRHHFPHFPPLFSLTIPLPYTGTHFAYILCYFTGNTVSYMLYHFILFVAHIVDIINNSAL